ncbi:MAG: hypothetical protein ACJ8M1_10795 [Chthoniobacterales bacterium]
MSASSVDPGDLLDLKLMPAWVKEPSAREDYADYDGDETRARFPQRDRERGQGGNRGFQNRDQRQGRRGPSKPDGKNRRGAGDRRPPQREFQRPEQRPAQPEQPLEIAVHFTPRPAVLENVVAQVKGESLAYSLFFLARSFLERPQRYEVALKAKPEAPLYRLGEEGPISIDRQFLESNAFRLAADQFYRREVTQSEPLKGNFTSVARCRLSGTVLGPTNHHEYQSKLRGLYEQRFSRRMNFSEYQRQIEIVSDPVAVENWKEEARNHTTFVTLQEPTPITFQSAAEAERHFRQQYLPSLTRSVEETVIDGVTSRQLGDRRLGRHIEQAWAVENRSPSHMMQELTKRFRDSGLHIFRHRRGMLFVSSIRVRPFVHDQQSVSPHVQTLLELIASSPRIRRKEVADKLLAEAGEDLETRKLALASDLRWLIGEGYVIEFNDGALDLPRAKVKKPEEKAEEASADSAEAQTTVRETPPDGATAESAISSATDLDTKSQPDEPAALPVDEPISSASSQREEQGTAVSEPPPDGAAEVAEPRPPNPSE